MTCNNNRVLLPGVSLIRVYSMRDEDGVLYDPTTLRADIVDSGGAKQASLTKEDFTQLSTGRYRLHYNLPLMLKWGCGGCI